MQFTNFRPKTLTRKVTMTIVVGVGCLLIGGAIFLYSGDRTTLLLSAMVMVFSLARAFGLYRTVSRGEYVMVEGTCVAVRRLPLRKHFTIKVMDDAGTETTLRLGKQARIRIGSRYRFYFTKTPALTLGNEYLDTALSHGGFLGFEDLGDIMEPKDTPDPGQAE